MLHFSLSYTVAFKVKRLLNVLNACFHRSAVSLAAQYIQFKRNSVSATLLTLKATSVSPLTNEPLNSVSLFELVWMSSSKTFL